MTTDINIFFANGCGRCNKYNSPLCKIHKWKEELLLLRNIILQGGLVETMKWGMPCYQYNGKNVLMIAPFKENCAITFFKGSLLKNQHELLVKAGEHSEQSRVIRFKTKSKITKIEAEILDLIKEAIELEKGGIKVKPKKISESDFPAEFLKALEATNQLKTAFNNLTPGKQKAYLIYFKSAKQASTRESRIKKHIPRILSGKGINE